MTGNMPLFIRGTIEDTVSKVLDKFYTGQRGDFGTLALLLNAGLITEADLADVMKSVTFTRPGVCVIGKISKDSRVIEVVR